MAPLRYARTFRVADDPLQATDPGSKDRGVSRRVARAWSVAGRKSLDVQGKVGRSLYGSGNILEPLMLQQGGIIPQQQFKLSALIPTRVR